MATVAEMSAQALKYHQAGDLSHAEHLYRQILQAEPDHADAWFFLGAACQMQGRLPEAIRNYTQAIELKPGFASAYYNLGLALEKSGGLDEAAESYQHAINVEPDNLAALINLGNVLKAQRKLDEALASYRRVLELKPDFAEVHSNLGNVLTDMGRLDEAVASYQHALRLRPDYSEAKYNLGILLGKAGRLEDAIASYRQALAINPNNPDPYFNLGNALRRTGHLDEALASFDHALQLQPDFAQAHWNRAVMLLALGDFRQGWPEYEWRWAQHSFARRQFRQPLWDGSNLRGRTILLYAEQGLGDTLHFIRFVPHVKQLGAKMIVECPAALLRLLKGTEGIDLLLAQACPLPNFDVQAPLLSLPGIFHTSLDNIPSNVPYLRADPELVDHWRRELAPLGGLKIGIIWQGSSTNPGDLHRSIPLAQFGRLTEVDGVRLISLQKNSSQPVALSSQQKAAMDHVTVHYLGSDLDEAAGAFMDTAAVMMNLDLVISADTATAHLAGALGVPVWLALTVAPDWRWLLEREDSPWYPTMRLFRQARDGHWESVFERMAYEIGMIGDNRR